MATTSPVLSTRDVMERYGMADARTARRVMDEAGAFKIAGRVVVRLEDLLGYEDDLRRERRRDAGAPAARPSRRSGAIQLARGWWREEPPAPPG